ncbi:MAG TPA: metallophosphoesterase family protein [Candidatus Sumerlaeota bacterium]|nr:metallophosphoesterase family protein [Candidatus Sumerlaeota bacterium]HPS00457.1 metallophosphoesterase family protein [Candidatus Sumerlaeota bacterium]
MKNTKRIVWIVVLLVSLGCIGKCANSLVKEHAHQERIEAQMSPPVKGLQKGPYLIYPGQPDSMTVLWQLDAPSSCTLSWQAESSSKSQSVNVPTYVNDFQYQYTLTGLAPAQRYFYQLKTADQQTSGSFRSAPADNANSVKFLVYGDTRASVSRHNRVCAGILKVLKKEPEYQTFLLHSGDLIDHGDSEILWANQFFGRKWKNLLALQANIPLQAVRGNHERDGVLFRKYWSYPFCASDHSYGSFDYGPVHVVMLDQFEDNYVYDPREISDSQMEWLRRDLTATSKAWKIILLHKPGWSTGQHGNCTSVQKQIQPICTEYGVAAVFSAHNHCYARADVDGVQHITTAGGGAVLCKVHPETDSKPYLKVAIPKRHFCKIAIDEAGFHLEAVEPDGNVLDSFTLATPPQPQR